MKAIIENLKSRSVLEVELRGNLLFRIAEEIIETVSNEEPLSLKKIFEHVGSRECRSVLESRYEEIEAMVRLNHSYWIQLQ